MQALLAGIMLVLAGQAALDNRYNDAIAGQQAVPPTAADPTAEEGLVVGAPDSADPTVAAPLNVYQAPASSQPDPAAPQRSVLAAGPKPSDLMRQLMKPPTTGQLSGVPITL